MWTVAVETMCGMSRTYFNEYATAKAEYDRLIRIGRHPYLYS